MFGGVYKLVAIEEPDGTVVPKIKVSENVEKITVPHFKKVYRFYGRDTGKAIADYMTLHDETVDDTKDLTIFDPLATWKKKRIYNFEARELLVPVFLNGKRVYDSPPLPEAMACILGRYAKLTPKMTGSPAPNRPPMGNSSNSVVTADITSDAWISSTRWLCGSPTVWAMMIAGVTHPTIMATRCCKAMETVIPIGGMPRN